MFQKSSLYWRLHLFINSLKIINLVIDTSNTYREFLSNHSIMGLITFQCLNQDYSIINGQGAIQALFRLV